MTSHVDADDDGATTANESNASRSGRTPRVAVAADDERGDGGRDRAGPHRHPPV